jgi:hypothetical protein
MTYGGIFELYQRILTTGGYGDKPSVIILDRRSNGGLRLCAKN